jgi:hypothetical protein
VANNTTRLNTHHRHPAFFFAILSMNVIAIRLAIRGPETGRDHLQPDPGAYIPFTHSIVKALHPCHPSPGFGNHDKAACPTISKKKSVLFPALDSILCIPPHTPRPASDPERTPPG